MAERAVVWHNNVSVDLSSNGSVSIDVRAINDSGLVVGAIGLNDADYACLWRDGELEFLEQPQGEWGSCAHDINNHGIAVGYHPRKPGFDSCVFWMEGPNSRSWRYTEFFPDFLPYEYTSKAKAMAINDRGVIVGNVSHYAFLKRQDTYVKFTTPSADGLWPLRINNQDVVVGYVVEPDEEYAFRYSSRLESLGTLAGSRSHALGINDAGVIVGSSSYETGSNDLHGFLWEAGRMHDLNNLIENPSKYTITSAAAINSSGQIAATAKLDGMDRAVLLDPV